MPHNPRISLDAVLAAARDLLETRGAEGVTMREVARRLGVSAPSLYFHVESRDDLLRGVITAGLRELEAGQVAATTAGSPGAALHALADAYLAFASANPALYSLIMGPCPEERMADGEVAAAASAPLLRTVGEIVPPGRVLAISQVFWALVHGFTSLIIAEQFRLGGDPPAAMHEAVDLLLAGLGVVEDPRSR
ncbi:MAG: TetR/AcrR family transcriptional regulator [Chloroflexi bacterium]|nr:TetR/AcrR family transcriptional regulator [Chloroflexota bacterium]